ncbi:PDZ domain-containing protein, partial [Rhizobium sp. CRIBSB]|nr:PDZ domain-containing protein [Rhizobium sp. CRIBSB]
VVAAGPAANFALAAVLFTLLFSIVGEQIIAPRVYAVQAGTPAAAAGFQPRDLIVAINGKPIRDASEVTGKVVLSAGDRVRFTVDRAGQRLDLFAVPERKEVEDEIAGRVKVARIGLDLRPMVRSDLGYRTLNPVEAAGKGISRIGEVVGTTVSYLGRIFTGRESGDLLNGPLGIAKAAGGITKQAAAAPEGLMPKIQSVALNLLQFAAIISIGIGFVNLLPIPVLDGGHLTFYAYEAVARRPVAARVQEASYRVGLALLAGLMLFATWNDLQKLNLFKFLGGLAS